MADREILTTTQAAHVLGASRQHLATLADRGVVPSWRAGSHRRFARSAVEAYRDRASVGRSLAEMTVTDRRSLVYGYLVAAKLLQDPERVLRHGRRNLAHLHTVHGSGGSRACLETWERLLDGPVETVLRVLTSLDEASVELRHASLFAGVLSGPEREGVLRATRRAHETRAVRAASGS